MEVLILCSCVVTLVLFPYQTTQGALEGIRLCGCTVIPGLFPFFFLTKLLGERLPSSWVQSGRGGILMSLVGGYPAGVATTVSMYKRGRISKERAQSLIPLCNNSGPGFFLGVLGTAVFRSKWMGLWLYLIHGATALLIFGLFSREDGETGHGRAIEKQSFACTFQKSLVESCETMVRVCGLVILFSVLRELVSPLLTGGLRKYWGIVELSSSVPVTGPEDFVLWAILMGWGGLCVHLQSMSIWQEAGLQVRGYFAIKALHGVLSGLWAGAMIYGGWKMMATLMVPGWIFAYFRKNWGRKKQHLAL